MFVRLLSSFVLYFSSFPGLFPCIFLLLYFFVLFLFVCWFFVFVSFFVGFWCLFVVAFLRKYVHFWTVTFSVRPIFFFFSCFVPCILLFCYCQLLFLLLLFCCSCFVVLVDLMFVVVFLCKCVHFRTIPHLPPPPPPPPPRLSSDLNSPIRPVCPAVQGAITVTNDRRDTTRATSPKRGTRTYPEGAQGV